MNRLKNGILATSLLMISTVVLAVPPKQLITHNTTDVDSNAYVASTIPSQHPTKAHSDSKVFWTSVRMACYGHIVNGKCPALIKMGVNTNNPVDIGIVELDLNTGEITPMQISGNGYTLIVNGPGESTIVKN